MANHFREKLLPRLLQEETGEEVDHLLWCAERALRSLKEKALPEEWERDEFRQFVSLFDELRGLSDRLAKEPVG